MTELINQAGAILEKSAELVQIPAISGAIDGLFGWLGGIFTHKSAKENLNKLTEQKKYDQETISALKANLGMYLEDNDVLQKQLAEKVKEIDLLAKQAGVQNVTKTNTMNITGDRNIGLQDISGGNIHITK